MFTGIVEEVGIVRLVTGAGAMRRLDVSASITLDGSALGASVAINGVCLTVVECKPDGFVFDVGPETLERTAERYRIILITKGDLLDQEQKLARSNLGDFFQAVEIVSDKSPLTYQRIFARHGDGPERSMMVGNSLKSDIVPAIEVGSWGVFIPHELTWSMEHADAPKDAPRFRQLERIDGLSGLLAEIDS